MKCKQSNGGNLLLFMKNEQQRNPLKCRFVRSTKDEILKKEVYEKQQQQNTNKNVKENIMYKKINWKTRNALKFMNYLPYILCSIPLNMFS